MAIFILCLHWKYRREDIIVLIVHFLCVLENYLKINSILVIYRVGNPKFWQSSDFTPQYRRVASRNIQYIAPVLMSETKSGNLLLFSRVLNFEINFQCFVFRMHNVLFL